MKFFLLSSFVLHPSSLEWQEHCPSRVHQNCRWKARHWKGITAAVRRGADRVERELPSSRKRRLTSADSMKVW